MRLAGLRPVGLSAVESSRARASWRRAWRACMAPSPRAWRHVVEPAFPGGVALPCGDVFLPEWQRQDGVTGLGPGLCPGLASVAVLSQPGDVQDQGRRMMAGGRFQRASTCSSADHDQRSSAVTEAEACMGTYRRAWSFSDWALSACRRGSLGAVAQPIMSAADRPSQAKVRREWMGYMVGAPDTGVWVSRAESAWRDLVPGVAKGPLVPAQEGRPKAGGVGVM